MYMSDTNACRILARKHERKIKLIGKTVLKFILKIGVTVHREFLQ